MSRGRTGTGVEIRKNDLRLRFTWHGRRYREPLQQLKPTAANIKYARTLYKDIKEAIDGGSFSYSHFFPNSRNAYARASEVETFGRYADLWLLTKGHLAAATRNQYRISLKKWKSQEINGLRLEMLLMEDIRHSQLAALIGVTAWPSPRMRNNALIPLRGVFAMWSADDQHNRSNPVDGIKNARFQRGTPDPFSPQEMERILAHLYKKYPEPVGAYFEFAFFSWTRPEELIAIRWSKLERRARNVKIDTVRTFRGGERPTKTFEAREIECNARAWGALMRMEKHTLNERHGHVFENPVTAQPWFDDRSQRENYWQPTIGALKLRYRTPYSTRHTGITLALRAGCDPAWVSAQAGHKRADLLWDVYFKWINGADEGHERIKLDLAFGRTRGASQKKWRTSGMIPKRRARRGPSVTRGRGSTQRRDSPRTERRA